MADTIDPDPLLARVRDLALALPAAAERPSHDMPGFHITDGKFSPIFRTIITATVRPRCW